MRTLTPSILYITHDASMGSDAATINTKSRADAMRRAGYTVTLCPHKPGRFIADLLRISHLLHSYTHVNIRIDGSGTLDKFTVLKLWNRRVKFIWEIHGFPEENYDTNYPRPTYAVRLKNTLRRFMFSLVIDAYIFVSAELARYATHKIAARPSSIISNFVLVSPINFKKTSGIPIVRLIQTSHRYVVLWGGFSQLKWQALDVVERVAKTIYTRDPRILFIVIGERGWHPFTWQKNILFVHPLPHEQFLSLLPVVQVCLALYHKPPYVPFYFIPLKLLDYMYAKKPVIASNQSTIATLISHKTNGLLTNNSINDIVAKILQLKNNSRMSLRMGESAKKTIHRTYTILQATTQYKRLFTSL